MPSKTQPTTPVVLLAFANERQQAARYLRALPDESRAIQAALDRAERAGLCELKILPNATPRDLVNAFQDPRYRDRIAAFHYGGHAGSYQLLLEDSAWENQAADAAGLVPLLKNQKALQFIFLNGCSTEPLARALTDAGIPAVVGTFESVKDEVAQQLAQQFYAGFGNGLSLGRAWSEAIASVQLTEGGDPRSMGWGEQVLTRFPWDVFVKKGAEPVLDWNLPDAVGDPLFGLPELPHFDLPDAPYRFLNRYKKADAPLFFGRARYVRELFERLSNPLGSPVVMLCGQSGVGKSSLLEAGLFPRLEQVCQLRHSRRDEAVGLLGTLRNALGIKDLNTDLRAVWKSAEKAKGKPLVIILDQAEEAFTRPCPQEPEEMARFAQALSDIFADPTDRPAGKILLGFRKEYEMEIDDALKNQQLPRETVFLKKLDWDDIIEVVEGIESTPRLTQKYGIAVEEDLPETIATDLLSDSETPVAPVLQIILTKLWQGLPQEGERAFTQQNYLTLKEDGIFLGDFFRQQMDTLRAWDELLGHQAEQSGLALDVLNFHTSQSDAVNSRSLEELQANYQHRADVVEALVSKFKELYLLTDSSPARNALAHDTLASVVHNAVHNSDRPGQKALRVLVSKMANYQRAPEQTYLDEDDLALVETGRDGMRLWMPEEEKLVKKSRTRRAKLQADRARHQRFRKYAWAAIGLLAIVALGAGYKFLQETKIAHIVAKARLKAEDDPTVAMKILEKARAIAPESHAVLEAYASIYSENEFYEKTFPHPAPVKDLCFGTAPDEALYTRTDQMIYQWRRDGTLQDSLAVSNLSAFALAPDGKTLVAANVEGALFVLNAANLRQPVGIFPQVNEGEITGFAFSPDGQKLFLIGHQAVFKTLIMSDLRANPSVNPLSATPAAIAIHPRRGSLLVGYENGLVEERSPDGKTVLHTLRRHTDKVLAFAFSPSGDTLVTAGRDALLCFWDKNGTLILPLKAHERRVSDVIWPKASDRIFSAGTDYRVNSWSPAGDLVAVYRGHTGFANAVAATADGRALATAGEDRVVRLWKAESKVRHRFGPHQNGVSGLALSRDGKTVLTGADAGRWQNGERMNDSAPTDPTTGSDPILDAMLANFFAPPPSLAFVWDTAKSGAPIHTLKGHDGGINAAAIRPEGAEFLTAGDDQKGVVWDANGNKIKELAGGHEGFLLGAAYAPDGRRIVTAGYDGQAIVWDDAGKILRKIPHGDIVSCAVFSPDGKYWATGCYDGWVRLFTAAGDSLRAFRTPNKKAIGALAFSPDGNSILVGEVNSTQAWLCTLEGAPRYALTVLAENKTGGQSINALAFSPDGRLACLAAQGGVAQVFRLEKESALPLQTLQHPHRWPILSVCFSSDGRGVLTGGGDGWARWWRL